MTKASSKGTYCKAERSGEENEMGNRKRTGEVLIRTGHQIPMTKAILSNVSIMDGGYSPN